MAGRRAISVASGSGLLGLLLLAAAQGRAAPAPPRPATFSFDRRVEAQRAIERVYLKYRASARGRLDPGLYEPVLERKVRTYLKQSVALEEFWHTPVTRVALRRELDRIVQNSHFPGRLAEIRAALGHDDGLMMETLARSTLVDRLARAFLASDERAQGPARREAEGVHRGLVEGRLDPENAHARRTVLEVRRRGENDTTRGSPSRRRPGRLELALDPDEFDRWRERQPAAAGEIGPVVEERDAFAISVTLSEQDGAVEVAQYTIPKVTWDEWWSGAAGRFDETRALQAPPEEPSSEAGMPADSRSAGAAIPSGPSCSVEDLWSGGHREALPEPRYEHTAVWTGSEMIIWGGSNGNVFLGNGARYDPTTDTWTQTSAAGAPAPRQDHTAVWAGSYMVVWGGDVGGAQTNTGGRYDPISDSWQPTSTDNAPSARIRHTAVSTGSLMIVWGGGISQTNTGGRYDPIADTWQPTSTVNAPTARIEHTAVWTGSEMIIWGGNYTNTGGRYDPSTDTWIPTSTLDAPSPRSVHTAVWTGSRMIVWGAFFSGFAPTGGRYDPATDTWSPTTQVGAPTMRYAHTAIWTGTRMIVWGGIDHSHSPPTESLNSGGRYDPVNDSWIPTTTLNAPSARYGHTAVWTGSLMIVWGGGGGSTGGRYDPASDSWTPTRSTRESPGPRAGPASVWTGNELLIWGGGAGPTGGRYDATTDSWSPMSSINAPVALAGRPAVWTGTEMIVWGGGEYTPLATGARYSPATDTWIPTPAADAPEARYGHSLVWTGTEMIVWGGGGTSLFNNGSRYDPATDSWSPIPLAGAPEPRFYHNAVWTGSEMIVWGGRIAGPDFTDTGARFDPVSDTWTAMSVTGAPTPRFGASVVWTGTEMIVWGGIYCEVTGGRYNPLADTWTPTTTTGAPAGRGVHTAVWTGTEMIVWGGRNCAGFATRALNTGGRYDPATDGWTPTTTTEAADARFDHVAHWTGRAMIVWGGRYYVGDVVYLIDDRSVRWYGSSVASPQTDADCDGIPEGFDCNDFDPGAWATPGEVFDVAFLSDGQTLTWSPTPSPGAASVGYDTLRSEAPADFVGASAVCVETNDAADTQAIDPDAPPAAGFFYLVRTRNTCPGATGYGSLGRSSSGDFRAGRDCP